MAKQAKRVALTLPPEVKKTLEELSALSGTAVSSIITQMVIESMPVYRALVEAYKAAKSDPEQLAEKVSAVILQAQAKTAQANLDLQDELKKQKPRKAPKK